MHTCLCVCARINVLVCVRACAREYVCVLVHVCVRVRRGARVGVSVSGECMRVCVCVCE